MAVELKDAIDYIDYTPEELEAFETIDAFKEDYDKKNLRRDIALKDKEFMKSVSGKLLNSLETKFTSIAKEHGVELATEEVKGVALEKVFESAFSKLTTASTTALDSLRAQIGKPDEAIKEWETKYASAQKEKEDFKKLLETTKGEFTTFKEQKETEIKGAKLSFQKEQLLSNVAWKAGIKEIEKQGFLSIVDKSAKFDFDADGKFVVTDLDGHLIPSKAKHGEFVKPDEFLKELGLKSEVIAINPHANGKPAPKPFNPLPASNEPQEQQIRKVNSFRPMVSQR